VQRKKYGISAYIFLTIMNEYSVKYYNFTALMYYTCLKSLYYLNYVLRNLHVEASCKDAVIYESFL